MSRKLPLIIGNWKMYPQKREEALLLAKAIITKTKKINNADVVIAPPVIYLSEIAKATNKSQIKLGVQHTHPGPVGAYTGEISPAMCLQYGVSYGIVGHSERRLLGETDTQIQAELAMLLKQGMTPILCIGERVRDAQANFYAVIENQLKTALAGLSHLKYKEIVIAYEPVWAIGTGKTATPADVLEMKLFIEKVLTNLSNRSAAKAVTIIYGGSVTGDTAKSLYTEGGVSGFLVGGASLKADDFTKIITATLP